jgi:hypothetical protein
MQSLQQLADSSKIKAPALYEQDYSLWLETTAKHLREKLFAEIDLTNLIEEIEAMGRSEKRAVRSQLTRLLMHLLKWEYQPKRRSYSWLDSIKDARKQIERLLRDSPSLKIHLNDSFVQCYQDAREDAADETRLPINTFPKTCPLTLEQVLDKGFLPPDLENF